MRISGSLVQSFIVCPRQTWFMARNLTGDQYNEFLMIGRLISETSYEDKKKEIMIGNNKIDFIKKKNNTLIIAETKKSSKMLKATEAQLLYYLFINKDRFENVRGEIRIPKEKKLIPIELNEDNEKYIQEIIQSINTIIEKDHAPEKVRKSYCKTCSYLEFCWA